MKVTCLLFASVLLSVPAQAKRDLADLRHIGRLPLKGRVQDAPSPPADEPNWSVSVIRYFLRASI